MIELYTRPGCLYCDRAKSILRSVGANYVEHIIDVTISRQNVLELFPNVKSLPIVVINGVNVGGYTELEQLVVEQREHIGKSFLIEENE